MNASNLNYKIIGNDKNGNSILLNSSASNLPEAEYLRETFFLSGYTNLQILISDK